MFWPFLPSLPHIPQFILIRESYLFAVYLSLPRQFCIWHFRWGLYWITCCHFVSVPVKGTLIPLFSVLRQEPLSSPVLSHEGRNLVISYFDSSNDIAVELLCGIIMWVWRLVWMRAEGLNQAALHGPPARGKKQLWLYSLAFVATNFLICFLGAAHEFPKEMLVFLKTESECIWHFWMSRTLGLLGIALS